MRTTLDLPENLLQEVKRTAKTATRREAVVIALEDYLCRKRLLQVVEAAGDLQFDLDPKELRKLSRPRTKP